MEVWFEIDRGWYHDHLTDSFSRELDPYRKDVEVLTEGGKWERAALTHLYSTRRGGREPAPGDRCCFHLEWSGQLYLDWWELKTRTRPHTPAPGLAIDKEAWDVAIDAAPLDWSLRGVFADWLEDGGHLWLMRGQRYQVRNRKTPGPACVKEAAWHEASWFSQEMQGTNWGMQGGRDAAILPEWCLPPEVFAALGGRILQRRDSGSHNQYAKSWDSRREAEASLARALETLNME